MKYRCHKHPDKELFITYRKLKEGQKCYFCYREEIVGPGSWHWISNLPNEIRERNRWTPEYKEWRQKVLERDNFKCVSCESDRNLVVHHLDGYLWCTEKRTDINNGVTLCEGCHYRFHRKYGKGDNTKEQFEEWMIEND